MILDSAASTARSGIAPPTDYAHIQNALLGAVLTGGPAGCDYAQIDRFPHLEQSVWRSQSVTAACPAGGT